MPTTARTRPSPPWRLWLRLALTPILGTPRSRRDPLGPRGERAAAQHLRRRRYRVIWRNLRLRVGEIDILCLAPDGRTIVVVEVKSRRTPGPSEQAPGSEQPEPEAAVGQAKRQKLIEVARWLVRTNGWEDRPLRIDVVGVDFAGAAHKPRAVGLRHHEGAVQLADAR